MTHYYWVSILRTVVILKLACEAYKLCFHTKIWYLRGPESDLLIGCHNNFRLFSEIYWSSSKMASSSRAASFHTTQTTTRSQSASASPCRTASTTSPQSWTSRATSPCAGRTRTSRSSSQLKRKTFSTTPGGRNTGEIILPTFHRLIGKGPFR